MMMERKSIDDAFLNDIAGGAGTPDREPVKGLEPRKPSVVPSMDIDLSNVDDPEQMGIEKPDPSFGRLPKVKI